MEEAFQISLFKYIRSGKIALAVPPEPEKIYVTLGHAVIPANRRASVLRDEALSNFSDDVELR